MREYAYLLKISFYTVVERGVNCYFYSNQIRINEKNNRLRCFAVCSLLSQQLQQVYYTL